MARRSLLTGDERRRLFELPVDDREVARHYTLSADDLKWIDARHGPGNQLGAVRHAVESATAAAWSTDKGGPIAQALMDALRARNIILPSPDTLERVGLAGRAQARRRAAEDLLARVSAEQLVRIDKLLVNDPELKMTPLAWLRDIPESPSAAGMAAITERIAYVRAIGIDPAIADAIHERRFDQYAREGAVAPAFLLSGYSVLRRRATVVAQLVDPEWRLNDAAVDMFSKMVGSLFAEGRRGAERKYQASSRELAQLMRLFSGVIEAVDQARADGGDAIDKIDAQVGWEKLLQAKPKVDALAALATEDPLVSAADRYATLRRFLFQVRRAPI